MEGAALSAACHGILSPTPSALTASLAASPNGSPFRRRGKASGRRALLTWEDSRSQPEPRSCTLRATRRLAAESGHGGLRRASFECHVANGRRNDAISEPSLAGLCDGAFGHVSDVERQRRTVEAIRSAGIVACVRADSADVALGSARAALAAGVSVLEVTCTTPGVFEVIASLVDEFPHACIGAGTVLTRMEAEAAQRAGALFLMSPATDDSLVQQHACGPLVFIPGAMTPTEILNASRLGAPLVKLFPAPYAGGEALVKAMHRAAPSVGIVAAHGIKREMIGSYLSAGAAAVVLSEAIFSKEAMKERDYCAIADRANLAIQTRMEV